MALRVTSLDELTPELVGQLFAEFTQMMQERHPGIELTRGPFHDIVSYFGSVFSAIPQTNIDKVLQSRSLLAISEDPSLAEPELVDHVTSNWGVTREAGSNAQGNITIVVSANEVVIVPASLEFDASGVSFRADGAFTGRPAGSDLPSASDRELQALGDGTYAFTISATAVTEGPEGNIRRGTKMIPQAVLPRFVTSYAANDFTDGLSSETNQQLLDKLNLGVAAKSTSSGLNVEAFIKNQPDFARTLSYSVVGMHDPEMMRDQHWILPMSGGGRVDIYSRTNELPRSTTLQVTATLVEITVDGGIWQFAITKAMAPGFYEVERVVLPDAGAEDTGYALTMDLRGFDDSDEVGMPDVLTAAEAAFTKYQTSVIRFLDTNTLTTGLTVNESTAVYDVSILAMPQIAEIQDLLSSRANRHRMADTLVKGAVPCFLQVNFTIRKWPGDADPDTDAIANALADLVNNAGFPGRLYASQLAAVIHGFLSGRQAVGAIDMFGVIRRPDNTLAYIRDPAILTVPDDPTRMVTGRTVAFFLDPRQVGINIITAGVTDG